MGEQLALYRRLVGARLRGQMQYKTSFVLQAVGNFGTNFVELLAILILFRHFDTMGGWTVGDVAFLYALSAIAFAFADAIAAGFSTFSQQIVRGDFDRTLVRPVAPFLQVLASDFQVRRVGRLLQGIIAFALALSLTDVPWSAGRVLYLPVVILSATVLFTALFTLEATLCFWTTQSTEVVNAFTYGGTTLAQYPLHVFDVWLRRLFLFVVPIGFVIFEPALYLLDRPDPLGLPPVCRFLAPVFAVAFAFAAGGLWRLGVAHYRSTGS
jgi:ABC-2 type transport system permease protein